MGLSMMARRILYVYYTYGNHKTSTSAEQRNTLVFSGTPNLACKANMTRSAALGRGWARRWLLPPPPDADNPHTQSLPTQHNLRLQ